MEYQEIENNEEWYRKRIEWRNQHPDKPGEGFLGKTVLLPDEDTPPELLDVFHLLMTARGPMGVEYAQEALHTEGSDYFTRFFTVEDEDKPYLFTEHSVWDDLELMKEHYEDAEE